MEGIIYIFTNKAMPDYIKIGITVREDIELIEKSRQTPATAFKFSMIRIQKKEELTFSRDEKIKCTVISENRVLYND